LQKVAFLRDRLGDWRGCGAALERAVRIADELLHNRPDDPEYLRLLSDCSARTSRLVEVLQVATEETRFVLNRGFAACERLQTMFPQEPEHRLSAAYISLRLRRINHEPGGPPLYERLPDLIRMQRELLPQSQHPIRDGARLMISLRELAIQTIDRNFEVADNALSEAQELGETLLRSENNDVPWEHYDDPELAMASVLISRAQYRFRSGKVDRADQEAMLRRAIAMLEKFLEIRPDLKFARRAWGQAYTHCLGDLLVATGRKDEASQAYRNVCQVLMAPYSPLWDSELGQAFNKLVALKGGRVSGDDQEMIALCRQFLQLLEHELEVDAKPPKLAGETWVHVAMIYGFLRDTDHQEIALRRAVAADPNGYEPSYRMGVFLFNSRAYGEALEYLDRAMEERWNEPYALSIRGQCHLALGHLDAAASDFNRCLEMRPAVALFHQRRWELHAKMNDFDAAVRDNSRSIELNSTIPEPFKYRARAYFNLRRFGDAVNDLAAAVELRPVDISNVTWFPPADVAKCPDEGFRMRMLGLADKVVDRTMGNPEAYLARGSLHMAMKQIDAAQRDFDLAAAAPGAKSDALRETLASRYNDLARQLATTENAELRDPPRAVGLAEKAVADVPRNRVFWNTLAIARYRAGDWPGARAAVQTSMELGNGGNCFEWFFAAMVYSQLGEKDEAARWYDQAVAWMEKNEPRNTELRRFRAEAAALMGR
jgi:tetratricopeptide (TPR) repeat protein